MRRTMLGTMVALLLFGGCAVGTGSEPVDVGKEMVVTTAVDIQSSHPYRNNTHQTWEIEAPAGALSTSVTFERFETETYYDFVDIYDADGVRVHHLTGVHTGESFEVHGNYLRIELLTDYSVKAWGIRITEYRYETTDPGHPTDHRPYCAHIGTPQEGWYWGDTEGLIELKRCEGKAEAQCGAIGSHSEGWFTSDPDPFIIWDSDCHRTVRIALHGESCGGSIGFTCHDGLYCHGWPIPDVVGGTGVCQAKGYCEQASDCAAEGNHWNLLTCEGYATCDETSHLCQWSCGQPLQGPWSWTSHLIRDVHTEHPYANDLDETIDVVGSPNATQIKVYFQRIDTEQGYDRIVLSGNVEENAVLLEGHYEDHWSPVFNGNTIHINFQSDGSVTDWGYAATLVSYYEQLPTGACNGNDDCQAGQYCFPHRCFNPYAPCYGHCESYTGGNEGDLCDGASRLCNAGLFCKGLSSIGEGTCQGELWCAPATVEADCANAIHPAVPGHWARNSGQCAWEPSLPPQSFRNPQKLDIPDDDPTGVQSDIDVTGVPTCDLLVSVDLQIDHTYQGDLVVTLTGPSGASTTLHNRTGAGTDNLVLQSVAVDGALLDTAGPSGTWSLHVADHAGLDVGTLAEWTLRFTCD